MFADRRDAGRRLARALERFRNSGALVLAIPRGGVEVGYEVARYLDTDFSLLISRKLPFPDNPESGFGAIAEDGSLYLNEFAARAVPPETMRTIIEQQRQEIKRRIRTLRNDEPLPPLRGRTVILVDDGIAMGSTMMAAIRLCRAAGAAAVIVAVPVGGERITAEIGRLADGIVVLEVPPIYYAVAQVYRNWYDVSDEEVRSIMARWRAEHPAG
ncbi:MAG TPA: phosphoribosyltransferase [Desulfobulbus sp.]|nr:phosphoribosyltransferase [Desulfobulbus sp.]